MLWSRVVSSARRHRYTYQEYLAFERSANVRHEFFDGEIGPGMADADARGDAREPHDLVALVPSSVDGAARRTPDFRIRVLETGLATYPHVTVVCGRREIDPEDCNTVTNPRLLVEVLSPSSAAYDCGEKLEHYQRIPSLREVLLVAQRRDEGRGDAGGAALPQDVVLLHHPEEAADRRAERIPIRSGE